MKTRTTIAKRNGKILSETAWNAFTKNIAKYKHDLDARSRLAANPEPDSDFPGIKNAIDNLTLSIEHSDFYNFQPMHEELQQNFQALMKILNQKIGEHHQHRAHSYIFQHLVTLRNSIVDEVVSICDQWNRELSFEFGEMSYRYWQRQHPRSALLHEGEQEGVEPEEVIQTLFNPADIEQSIRTRMSKHDVSPKLNSDLLKQKDDFKQLIPVLHAIRFSEKKLLSLDSCWDERASIFTQLADFKGKLKEIVQIDEHGAYQAAWRDLLNTFISAAESYLGVTSQKRLSKFRLDIPKKYRDSLAEHARALSTATPYQRKSCMYTSAGCLVNLYIPLQRLITNCITCYCACIYESEHHNGDDFPWLQKSVSLTPNGRLDTTNPEKYAKSLGLFVCCCDGACYFTPEETKTYRRDWSRQTAADIRVKALDKQLEDGLSCSLVLCHPVLARTLCFHRASVEQATASEIKDTADSTLRDVSGLPTDNCDLVPPAPPEPQFMH